MQAVEGMKLVCHELIQVVNDADITAMDDLVRDLDHLVMSLSAKVNSMFGLSMYEFLLIFLMPLTYSNLIIDFCDCFEGR